MGQSNGKKDVSPPLQSSVDRMRPYITNGLVLLSVLYMCLIAYLRDKPIAIPSPEYCPGDDPSCTRPDLYAFQMTSLAALCYCGFIGFKTWYITRRVHTAIPQTPESRVFGYLKESEELAAINFTFQFWDLLVSFFIAEHCTPVMMIHHFVAAFVSWSSLECQYFHYYGVFFLGLTEFCSIFLVFIDLAKFFPPEPGTVFDMIVGISGPCFAATFFVFRILMWWKESFRLFYDVIHVLRKGLPQKLRPGREFVLYIFLALNIPMGMLQLYWFQIIVREVVNVLLSGEPWDQSY